jgi:hypothetical protein
MIVRKESLRIGGQGLDFVLVCMRHINKYRRCRVQTNHDE